MQISWNIGNFPQIANWIPCQDLPLPLLQTEIIPPERRIFIVDVLSHSATSGKIAMSAKSHRYMAQASFFIAIQMITGFIS